MLITPNKSICLEMTMTGSNMNVNSRHITTHISCFPSFIYSGEASGPTHKIQKYIVFETCLMELFKDCPLCKTLCINNTSSLGLFCLCTRSVLTVTSPDTGKANHFWESTPAGNLQLSATVYLTGSSFNKITKVNEEQQYV